MRSIALTKATGESLKLALNNYGSGVDRLNRRWVLDAGCWNCIETGETAERTPLLRRLFGESVSHQKQLTTNVSQRA